MTAPEGHGNKLEFEGNSKKDSLFMERENHTVWYEFQPNSNGMLLFELEPIDSLDDYDFSIYEYTDSNFCQDVADKKILPLRSNFSRNKIAIKGKTGLAMKAVRNYVGAGLNPAYASPLPVDKTKTYVLLVNNVYDNGQGHFLHFDYSVKLKIEGNVVDIDAQHALEAKITLTNTKTGTVLATTQSDSSTGDYQLDFDIAKSQMNDPLQVEVFKDGYVFKDTLLTAFKIATKMRGVKLQSKIKKLKKGDRFVCNNILFHGDSPKPLNRSLPSLKSLYKTMKRNKNLKISIEGHTNGCSKGETFSQNLSDARAQTVYNFLTENNIQNKRMTFVGFGCKHLIHSLGGPLQHLNRRVEIEILEL